ncbi:hypothetical protein CCMA1212_003224 [Trichoderma ghanense]|uniref:Uncharacterized protein n=1 Tax=Trichoderma ghanense TaxID=65468 RepID=A0ABY2H8R2_9HYPO
MSDGIAPAVDKVGAPAPEAPEAQAGAPTVDMGADTAKPEASADTAKPEAPADSSVPSDKPKELPIVSDTKAPEDAKDAKDAKPAQEPPSMAEAFKESHKPPRSVEVQSVPETPVNTSTPANGSPRPELPLSAEPEEPEKPKEDPVLITEVQEPLPTPSASAPGSDVGPDSIVDKPATPNGESKPAELMAGALQTGNAEDKSETSSTAAGEKRKQPDAADADAAADEAAAEKEDSEESERADKKVKIDDNGKAASNGGTRKPGRPKKDKKAAPVVGKTLRKTRSQGPVEI